MKRDNPSGVQDPGTDTPLAIIGMACVFPGAGDVDAYWRFLKNGEDAIMDVPATHWSPADYFDADPKAADMTYATRGGFIPEVDFDPMAFGIAPNALEATDTSQLLGLVVAQRALSDAGYGGPDADFDRTRVSVILGVTGALELVGPLSARLGHPLWRRALADAGVDEATAARVIDGIADGYVPWQEASFPGLLGNVVAGRIANRLDLGGTNCVVDAACASSVSAVHIAAMELAAGRSDMVISGGVDTFNDIFMYMCFSKTPALSPTGDARPFDHKGDGTILGEGLGMVVLKRLDHAVRDGDRIYAEIRGIGTSSDGKGNAVYAPDAGGQARALSRAYRAAGVSPATVELVEAHGTGTVVGDAVEATALTEVYRQASANGVWCAIGSVKSQIGHTKAAAGAAALIKAALALHHKTLPPTIKVEQPLEQLAPGASPFYVNTDRRPWIAREDHPRRAALSSFGFGGSNFHCVLQEHESEAAHPDWNCDTQILAYSAASRRELIRALEAPVAGDWNDVRAFGAQLRTAFSDADPQRVLLVAERNGLPAAEMVQRAVALLEDRGDVAEWSTPDGIFFGSGTPAGDLALLFPGQGSQYIGMARDLTCQFPQLRTALAAADAADRETRLSDRIYPHPAFDDAQREADKLALRDTAVAQPALGAIGYGIGALLAHFGILPAAVAGHSFGELTALCCAGRLIEADLHALARLRGSLMAGSNRGSMLAVEIDETAIESFVAESGLDLTVANHNAPKQMVLSGADAQIATAREHCAARGITCHPLAVSAAFHSPLIAAAVEPFAAALARVQIGPGRCPVYANSTATPYPAEAALARRVLAEQLVQPVRFVDQVRAMYADGIHTFVEIGPAARLSGLVKAILADQPHAALAIDASHGRRSGISDLARALAHIAALGHVVELARWDAGFSLPAAQSGRTSLSYRIGGANIRANRRNNMNNDSDRDPAQTGAGNDARSTAEPLPGPVPERTPPEPAATSVTEALRITQENMVTLQRLQEQTAKLHAQFLENQNSAQQSFLLLQQQQQRLLDSAIGRPIDLPESIDLPVTLVAAPDAAVVEVRAPMPAEPAPRAPLPASRPDPAEPAAAVEQRETAPAPGAPAYAEILLEVVAEKTGYPADVLELGMELDADLGIDSIKRVEIISALQERLPEAPVVQSDQLGSLRTLAQVLDFLSGASPAQPPQSAPAERAEEAAPSAPPVATPAPRSDPLQRLALRCVDLNGDDARDSLSITPGSTIWISDGDRPLAERLAERLIERGFDPQMVSVDKLNGKPNGPIGGLVLLAPAAGTGDDTLHDSLKLLQSAGTSLRASGRNGGALLVTVSRLDGAFGLDGESLQDPLSGGLAGLAKSAAHEWPEVQCRALDLGPDLGGPDCAADAIAEEMFLREPLEVGISRSRRRSLTLEDIGLARSNGSFPLSEGDVVLISGGARGVTAETALALARACRPTLLLLGRSRPPAAEPAWLQSLVGEEEIKRGILDNVQHASGLREVGERYQEIVVQREIAANLERLRATGCRLLYRQVDVRDGPGLHNVVNEVCTEFGPVRGLIHGAGVISDRLILDETDGGFEQVYDTKVMGLRNLLEAIDDRELRVLVLFSSSTARFGRRGQVDYAIANEVLNKMAQDAARRLADCKVVSINWGPWDGGMVDAGLRDVFQREGVPLIPLAQGAEFLLTELAAPEKHVELVVLGADGEPNMRARQPLLPVAFERELDRDTCSFLGDHVFNGRAVVPLALMIEWIAHGALHNNPGLVFCGCDDVRVVQGITVESAQRRRVAVHAGRAESEGDAYRVPVEIWGGTGNGEHVLHLSATVRLADTWPAAAPSLIEPAAAPYSHAAEAIYREQLFHGPLLQGLKTVESCAADGIVGKAAPAATPEQWMRSPVRNRWITDPLAMDAGFQLMILWCLDQLGLASLPCHIRRLRQYSRFPADGVRIVVRVTGSGQASAFADMEFLDNAGNAVARIEGYECVVEASLQEAFRDNCPPQAVCN